LLRPSKVLSKAQARSLIRELVKDESMKIWSDSSLDVLTQLTIDEQWGEVLLDQAPYLNSQVDILAPITPGYLDLRTISAGGQLTQRFYRIQKVTLNNQEYSLAHSEDVAFVTTSTTEIVAPRFSYLMLGSQLYLFPLNISFGSSVEFRYSFIPPSFTSLHESDIVQWPDGYENAYAFESAARALLRSDATLAGNYHNLAQESQRNLSSAIARMSPGPITPHMVDTPISWGSV
jgi:hypothetical protein